ncbi:MAG: ABC transporter permease, partial [Thermoanaerobaculia bacterium]
MRASRLAALALALLLAWIIGWPLLVTFGEALGLPGPPTLAHLAAFAERPDEWVALWRSLWISLASTALAGAVGVPLGFLFAWAEFPGRRALGTLIILPVALPPLVGVIAFLFLYGESGLATRAVGAALGLARAPWRLQGPLAILLVHAYSMYVYFYLFTRAALARFDGSLLEAAAALGAGRARTLWAVILPVLRPALLGAALLTFMTALGSFSAPYLFGGDFRVLPTQIVASKLNGELAAAQVETVALAGLAITGLFLLRRFDPRRPAVGGVRGVAPARRRLGRPAARLAAAAAGWLLGGILLLPHLTLLLISFVPPGTWRTEALPPVLSLANWTALGEGAER